MKIKTTPKAKPTPERKEHGAITFTTGNRGITNVKHVPPLQPTKSEQDWERRGNRFDANLRRRAEIETKFADEIESDFGVIMDEDDPHIYHEYVSRDDSDDDTREEDVPEELLPLTREYVRLCNDRDFMMKSNLAAARRKGQILPPHPKTNNGKRR